MTTPHQTRISRDLAREYGHQAVQILEAGQYVAPSGRTVQIGEQLERAVQGTVSYPPDVSLPEAQPGPHATRIQVINDSTLAAARLLLDEGHHPAALNFASANRPGGGFLNGALAQEEYLARSSGLYACLRDNPMYGFHRAQRNALYTDYVLYSPEVPVFRGDDGSLLEEPYTVGIITAPAVNARALRKYAPGRKKAILPAMWSRILKVLAVGLQHGHDSLVLGAWGCGAFGNDSRDIASLFHRALTENFQGAYRRIIFAILDWSEEKRYIGPFEELFG